MVIIIHYHLWSNSGMPGRNSQLVNVKYIMSRLYHKDIIPSDEKFKCPVAVTQSGLLMMGQTHFL